MSAGLWSASSEIAVDCVVIGAGVVGLAVARSLQLAGREVFLVEAAASYGTGASSRNSEVIHAGIYYPPGTHKATLCVRGREMLYAYCKQKGIPHQQIGKVIVAVTEREEAVLTHYLQTAQRNGAGEIRWLSAKELRQLEPEVVGVSALHSPRSGIIDSHAFMKCLLADFLGCGGHFIPCCPFDKGEVVGPDVRLFLRDAERTVVRARLVVNSAGLCAVDIAKRIAGCHTEAVPHQWYAIGHYYRLSGPSPFQRLVYPVPERGGLGVHVTLDLDGMTRFGPDVRWTEELDYTFDDSRRHDFVAAIQRYYPSLDARRLEPGYTGIRTKISGPDQPGADFEIHGPSKTGHQGLVHLFGIESPGLTASLAIGEHVTEQIVAQKD
jgi:L-2-hydroxyglutarate oxidase LhgO